MMPWKWRNRRSLIIHSDGRYQTVTIAPKLPMLSARNQPDTGVGFLTLIGRSGESSGRP